MEFNETKIAKIVLILNGDISFHGISEYDKESARNMHNLGNVIDYLLDEIAAVHINVRGQRKQSAKEIDNEIQKIYANLGLWAKNFEEK